MSSPQFVSASAGAHTPIPNGLVTLAQAAAFRSTQDSIPGVSDHNVIGASSASVNTPHDYEHRAKRRQEPLDSVPERILQPPQSLVQKRRKSHSPSLHPYASNLPATSRGPELPPILNMNFAAQNFSPARDISVPNYPMIPPISAIASLAGTGCNCGLHCACPGCVKHRGDQYASKDFDNCDDGCGTCVDHEGEPELPIMGQPERSGSSAPTSFIDAFFARAATLPLPPNARTSSLDATNVTIYPSTVFTGAPREREERGAAFGLVALPPLKCGCSGGCGCPEGQCTCGDGCSGCCDDSRMEVDPQSTTPATPTLATRI